MLISSASFAATSVSPASGCSSSDRCARRFSGHRRVDAAEPLLDARQVGGALRVDVADHLRDAERELALLLGLALREQLADAPDDLGVRGARAQVDALRRPESRDEPASSALQPALDLGDERRRRPARSPRAATSATRWPASRRPCS